MEVEPTKRETTANGQKGRGRTPPDPPDPCQRKPGKQWKGPLAETPSQYPTENCTKRPDHSMMKATYPPQHPILRRRPDRRCPHPGEQPVCESTYGPLWTFGSEISKRPPSGRANPVHLSFPPIYKRARSLQRTHQRTQTIRCASTAGATCSAIARNFHCRANRPGIVAYGRSPSRYRHPGTRTGPPD